LANRPEFRYARSGELYFFLSNSGNFPGSLLKSDRILNWFVSGQLAADCALMVLWSSVLMVQHDVFCARRPELF